MTRGATTGLLPDDFAIIGVDHSDGSDDGWRDSLDEMMRSAHVTEVVLLSTCNRIEVLATVDAFHGGLADVRHAC